jgi:hypothetical protein
MDAAFAAQMLEYMCVAPLTPGDVIARVLDAHDWPVQPTVHFISESMGVDVSRLWPSVGAHIAQHEDDSLLSAILRRRVEEAAELCLHVARAATTERVVLMLIRACPSVSCWAQAFMPTACPAWRLDASFQLDVLLMPEMGIVQRFGPNADAPSAHAHAEDLLPWFRMFKRLMPSEGRAVAMITALPNLFASSLASSLVLECMVRGCSRAAQALLDAPVVFRSVGLLAGVLATSEVFGLNMQAFGVALLTKAVKDDWAGGVDVATSCCRE